MTLEGKAALVSGAASGIGRSVAEHLSQLGAHVLAVDVTPDASGPGIAHQADLTDPQANTVAVAAAIDRFGRLDIVVPNAGLQHVAPIEDFPLERFQSILALMLTSPFLLAQSAWGALRASGSGRFIAIGSAHSLVASPYKAAYVSAKHGLLGLVKTLALEGAEYGIRATAVCPGYVRTPLVERQIEDQSRAHDLPPDRVTDEILLAPHAVKELIEADDVAEVVGFLAGTGGRSFTGAAVVMDQGWTAR